MEYECRGKKGAGGGRDREICEREAPKIDAFPMQNSRSTTLLVAGQHATGNPLLTSVSLSLSISPSFPLARARYGMPRPCPSFSTARTSRLLLHRHQRLRHLRPEQNRERYRSN